jgi:hypothetical protein
MPGLRLCPQEVFAVGLAAVAAIHLSQSGSNHFQIYIDRTVPDHGQNPVVAVWAVGIYADCLDPDQAVKIIASLHTEGLARFLAVGDLGRVYAQEANAELGLILGDSDDRMAVADALHGGDEGARGGGVGGVPTRKRGIRRMATGAILLPDDT